MSTINVVMNSSLLLQIEKAKKSLLKSGVVCFPTETVMGLGVFYNDFNAYNKLNTVKERPEDKPYTMMVSSIEDIDKYAFVDEKIARVINTFMPGSLTLLLKVKDNVPNYVTHGTGVIGIRIPSNEEALELLKEVKIPLLVPSANKSGQKPAFTSEEAKAIFGEEVDCYFDGHCGNDKPSTIVDLSKDEPVLIRKGPISFDAIKAIYYGHKFEDTVICYLIKDEKVLMLFRDKKEVDINKGKWIGVGGHIEKGESPEKAIIREVWEETTLCVNKCEPVADITFYFKNDVEVMHVFTCTDFSGEVDYNCPEGTLEWIPVDKLFSIPLWEGDKLFLKPIFNKEPFFEMMMKYEGDTLVEYKKI